MPVDAIFQCHKCGQCCEGRGGIIVSPADLERLASHLSMSVEKVKAQYCELCGGKIQIRCGDDGFCIFFHKTKGCGVHERKPAVCQAWPFFRGNLEDPSSLSMAKDFCPGINPDVTHENFASFGREYLREHNLVSHDASREANALIVE
ncbi:MAG: YkgJ family cysteine cluster protein [Desulfovibrio sp.]|nr:YkgJ family cysteine cluster protein [Desulfovibrio sp.]